MSLRACLAPVDQAAKSLAISWHLSKRTKQQLHRLLCLMTNIVHIVKPSDDMRPSSANNLSYLIQLSSASTPLAKYSHLSVARQTVPFFPRTRRSCQSQRSQSQNFACKGNDPIALRSLQMIDWHTMRNFESVYKCFGPWMCDRWTGWMALKWRRAIAGWRRGSLLLRPTLTGSTQVTF